MGLLDDAIREHLDLKRRHGADPAEIERAEREALGPVRRGPAQDVEPELGFEPVDDEAPIYDEHDEEHWDEVYEEEGHHLPEEPHLPEPVAASSPPLEPPPPTDLVDRAREVDAEPPGEETVEYDVEHALEEEASSEGDMLEETPEFLQDAPDHDRLWFEQRPPRDFDFDD